RAPVLSVTPQGGRVSQIELAVREEDCGSIRRQSRPQSGLSSGHGIDVSLEHPPLGRRAKEGRGETALPEPLLAKKRRRTISAVSGAATGARFFTFVRLDGFR